MSTRKVLMLLIVCAALPCHALETEALSASQLRALGKRLAAEAGASQWQQLWQNTRREGRFAKQPERSYFSLPQAQLPGLAQQTLAQAHQVEAFGKTRARYRHDFTPLVIGREGTREISALCLEVDWRTLPALQLDTPNAYLGLVGLLRSYPCD